MTRDIPLETEDENLANRGQGHTRQRGSRERPEGERAASGTRETGEKGLPGRKQPF